MARPRTVHDVAAHKLCTGCGVCAYLAPDEIRMVDVLDHGRRPLPVLPIQPSRSTHTPGTSGAASALRCCPGVRLEHETSTPAPGEIAELRAGWGPVRAIWEGYAADERIRFAGSSGGVATALAAYCLEQAGMAGVLHIGARSDVPYLNETRFSRTREELLAAAGSRYAPASPCDRLDLVESAEVPCVFIGKPCDVAAVRMARQVKPELDARVGLTIAVFCAGTPSTRGTLEMLRQLGTPDPQQVASVHYRGNGWPGRARARLVDDPRGRSGRSATSSPGGTSCRSTGSGAAISAPTTPASSPTWRSVTRGTGRPGTIRGARWCWPAPSGAYAWWRRRSRPARWCWSRCRRGSCPPRNPTC